MVNIEIGGIYQNNKGQSYKVLRQDGVNSNHTKTYLIEFLDTRYQDVVTRTTILQGGAKDYLEPSRYGVGCLGARGLRSKHPKEHTLWNNMLSRCYNDSPSNKDYMSYGGIGVKVDKRWHSLQNFIEDMPKIKGYDATLFNKGFLQLDKDKLQNDIPHRYRIYSLENCMFVSEEVNQYHRDSSKYRKRFLAISPSGRKYVAIGVVDFAKEYNLDASSITRVIDGVYKQHKGWKFKSEFK